MLDKIFGTIQKYHMLEKGETAVCGLSGGADSVCLLLALRELAPRLGITVEAIHVNHCLRGEESDRDEEFCRDLCRKLQVPFTAVRCDVKSFAQENGLSTEEAARELRYKAFAENSAGKKLATAHNAGDDLETALLNLTRGTALRGMCGIPPVRGSIIRPLLAVTRREIEDFLKQRQQPFVTDSTNLSNEYTRNKLRHIVIPALEEINGSVIETSVRSFEAMREENALIEELTDQAWAKCRQGDSLVGLDQFHKVIRRRCIARLLAERSLPYSYERLIQAEQLCEKGGKICLSGDLFLVGETGRLSLKQLTNEPLPYLEKELAIGENCLFQGKILLCEEVDRDEMEKICSVHKKLTIQFLDHDKIKGRAVLRSRKFGDRIRLAGRDHSSSIKKLINEFIPPDRRSTLHFIEDAQGTIFAEGLGVSQSAAPDQSSKRLLKITVVNL
ncbi:MAG TPA: tRNA lysidine(34) synthetase TilS [Ruminococcus sp.]|nr:tRNA lysidine(34) synthetase TilS [Ruminococcus sp.]